MGSRAADHLATLLSFLDQFHGEKVQGGEIFPHHYNHYCAICMTEGIGGIFGVI